ncbi:MAG: hypothetical protein A2259_05070 [Candidatus Moranbacteria bacterium RIFOXYA2_FULL_43_15]|nr:MAG: hypothetical protein A2259_05070 [Candidatus Moranbacteria bacterium RIFOXYA2_FULL_43_15]
MEKSIISKEIRRCHFGEGFFLSLLSEYAILHKVEGGNDIGIDYFCEWINQENSESTNVLFAVQLKTTQIDKIILTSVGNDSERSWLPQYEIKWKDKEGKSNGNFDNTIKPKTIEYWRGFEIPVYLFVIVVEEGKENKLLYKRYTPILHRTEREGEIKFHLANNENSFLAFANKATSKGGFCRDLYIDYIRCNYEKGAIIHKDPRELGLNQFPKEKFFFKDLLTEQYKDKVQETIDWIEKIRSEINGK